ncbi:MAG: DUF1674 domain-containing protein [Pseudomonadota bacterium]
MPGVLIFVFAGVSYGRERPILAEFAPVPNAPSEVDSASEAAIIAVVAPSSDAVQRAAAVPGEVGGPPGPEPTRFGDWEKNGRCVDF